MTPMFFYKTIQSNGLHWSIFFFSKTHIAFDPVVFKTRIALDPVICECYACDPLFHSKHLLPFQFLRNIFSMDNRTLENGGVSTDQSNRSSATEFRALSLSLILLWMSFGER